MRTLCVALLGATLALGACDLAPDVGPNLVPRCDNSDSDPGTSVSFATDILPLFARESGGCAGCHDPSQPSAIGVTVGGLELTSYSTLLEGGARTDGSDLVVPGDPCSSVLIQKVRPGPPFGARMPLNGPPFLGEADIQLVHDWIAEGAGDN